MVIIGLGSNLGDRLYNLRQALTFLKKIPDLSIQQVSPLYLSDALVPSGASTTWDIPYLNLAIRCETTLAPYELLQHAKDIEIKVGREPNKKWGPRIIDIDLLAWDDLIQYDQKLHIPHEGLLERPFALWPLADIAPQWLYPLPGPHQGQSAAELVFKWGSRFNGQAPFHTKQIQQRIDTPELVGILNLTPDSFSNDGLLTHVDAILQKVDMLIENGAHIIDIGAEATGPKAIPLNSTEEWERLNPFLVAILNHLKSLTLIPKISIDTRHADVARRALELGVDWINDVSGLTDPLMQEIIAKHTCDIVVMHNLGVPVTQSSLISSKKNPIAFVSRWAEMQLNVLVKEGIAKERIIFDVGIGYGKTAEQSLQLIKHVDLFRSLNTRLLIGHSRKSFLQQFTPHSPTERDLETTVLSLYLANKAVDFLRVHNVELHARAFKVAGAMSN